MAKKERLPDQGADEPVIKETFDEWLCDCKRQEDGSVKVDRLKKLRSGVTITAEQAEILNEVQYGNNPVPVTMYFPAE